MDKIDPLEYLPEVYRKEGSFTQRFLSVFTEIYRGLEEKIDASAGLYDPEKCPDEFVGWLGEWISAENMRLFPKDKKRELLLMTPRLNSRRGTMSSLRELLELYCGAKVFIVECYHVRRYLSSCGDLERMYSCDRFTVWILCSPAENVSEIPQKIIDAQLPANITAKTKLLLNITELNNYCYLGVNSVLSGTRPGALDGRSGINYVHLGGGRR